MSLTYTQEKNNKFLPSPPNSSCGGDDKEEDYLLLAPQEEENYTIEHTPNNKRRRRGSTTSSGSATTKHRCIECGKVYKNPNCLSKHQWEHSEEWEFTSKFLLTKHQQVQLLEAAAILMNMMNDKKTLYTRNSNEEDDNDSDVQIDMDDDAL